MSKGSNRRPTFRTAYEVDVRFRLAMGQIDRNEAYDILRLLDDMRANVTLPFDLWTTDMQSIAQKVGHENFDFLYGDMGWIKSAAGFVPTFIYRLRK